MKKRQLALISELNRWQDMLRRRIRATLSLLLEDDIETLMSLAADPEFAFLKQRLLNKAKKLRRMPRKFRQTPYELPKHTQKVKNETAPIAPKPFELPTHEVKAHIHFEMLRLNLLGEWVSYYQSLGVPRILFTMLGSYNLDPHSAAQVCRIIEPYLSSTMVDKSHFWQEYCLLQQTPIERLEGLVNNAFFDEELRQAWQAHVSNVIGTRARL